MMTRAVAATVALLAAVMSASLAAQAIERSLHVSVVDRDGNGVADLGPSDFIVREDKVAREVLRVARADDPMQIAVLVDESAAAVDFVGDYREGVTAFINGIAADKDVKGQHKIAIVTLASRPTINTNYTSDQALLVKGAQRIFSQTDSATTLLDGIAEISEGMIKQPSRRPVIVAITTEGPEASNRVYLDVLEKLTDSGAALHVIVVGRPRNNSHQREIVLSNGTHDSGGRLENIFTSSALPGLMTKLASELTHQYLVTYAHPQSLIPPDDVTVSAAKPNMTARGTLIRDAIEERK